MNMYGIAKNVSLYITRFVSIGATVGVLIALSVIVAFADGGYTVVDLGAGYGNSINAKGQVAGFGSFGNVGYGNRVISINDLGQQVGVTNEGHAALFTNGTVTQLGILDGKDWTPHDMNNSGQVVGFCYTANGSPHATLYSNGTVTDLGTLGGSNSFAWSINNSGQIAGWSTDAYGGMHAALWSNGTVTDLGSLYGASAIAYGINDLGQAVGIANSGAALFSNGIVTNIGGNRFPNKANNINNSGVAVGQSVYKAAIFKNGTVTNLNSLASLATGTSLTEAMDINDSGQIIANGSVNGVNHAFLLTPTPIPPAFFLMGSGLIGLVGFRRKIA